MSTAKLASCLRYWLLAGVLMVFGVPGAAAATPESTQKADAQAAAMALEKVSLQLIWKHQFQFAGFYAALEKGFYREHGLDVEIREYVGGRDILGDVVSGRATYGLTNSRVVEARLAGMPVRLLANYFKRSALIIVAQPGVRSLSELAGKRLMIDHKDLDSPLIWRAFQDAGLIPGENLEIVPHAYDPSPFINGEVDATTAFVTNERFQIETSGIPFEVIDLAKYLPSAGDMYLFTADDETTHNPERTMAFVEASHKGWQYALDHPDEIIDLILEKYSQRKSREALRYEAEQVLERVLPLDFPLGVVYPDRIETVAAVILEKRGGAYDLARLKDFLFVKPGSGAHVVNLTLEERAWLKAHPTIRVGIDPQWAPVEFVDEMGVPQGISLSYLRRLETLLGVKFEIASNLTWLQAHERLERGELDLLPAISETSQRRRLFHFTEPYLSIPINIFSAQDVAYLGSIKALRGKRVAVVEGYAIHDWLKRDYPELELAPAPSLDAAVRWVAAGEAFALIDNLVTTSYYIGKSGLAHVRVAGETPYSNRLGIAVRQDAPLLAGILQKGLDAIPQSERDAIYNEWISISYKHSVDYTRIWQLLAVSGLIVAIVLYWNRRLAREVTRRRSIEQALKLAKLEAEASNRAKSDFLAKMSHEIRTPMNAMIGLTHRLRQTELTPRQTDYLDKIHSASATLLGIIDDILDFSKIEANKLTLDSIAFRIDDVLQQIKFLFGDKARQQGLGFHIERDGDVPECLLGDPRRLAQILINLVDNAVKFTLQGDVTVRVGRVVADPGHIGVAFHVKDTGPGISEEDQARLFQPFSQVDNSLMRRHGGSGLGLAISRSLARMMGGEVVLTSQPGVGSTFSFVANFRACDDQAVVEFAVVDAGAKRGTVRVLLVEDDALNQWVAREFLEQFDAVVTIANNGVEALEWLERATFDLVLMDLQMPEMDGYEAVNRIRRNPAWAHLPIVAMTAHAIAGERNKCLSAGMNDYLTKPIEPAHLAVVVDEWGRGGGRRLADHEAPPSERVHARIETRLGQLYETLGEARGKALLIETQTYLAASKTTLVEALNGGHWTEAAAIAHDIKGAFSLYGSARLERLLKRVAEGPVNPGADRDLADELTRCLEETLSIIDAWLAGHAP